MKMKHYIDALSLCSVLCNICELGINGFTPTEVASIEGIVSDVICIILTLFLSMGFVSGLKSLQNNSFLLFAYPPAMIIPDIAESYSFRSNI